MSTIVTRAGKGSPLTNNEVDSNFTNLNTDKVESITSADGSVVVSTSGTIRDLSVGTAANTGTLISQVRNETGATLAKGTVVYISGAAGNKAVVSKALASGDSTSAQTYGMVQADIPHNQNGYVVVIGAVSGLNTSAFADGTQLYVSGVTAGTYTSTKPYAPTHLVYVGIVTYSHATQGTIQVKIQNGYEMDEIHDVSAQSPTNGDTLVYNSSTTLWTKTAQSTLSVASAAAVPFSGVTSKPTTLSGYGITDAYSSSNPSGYITSSALSPYLTTATAASTYLPLAGGTLTGQITLVPGTPWQVLAPGSGTYNRHVQYITETEYTLEAAFATDSLSGSKLPITFTWRGGYGATGGLQLTGGASGTLGGNTILHAGNYTTYSPTLTGGSASGTWAINITGNAATATNAQNATFTTAGNASWGGRLQIGGNGGASALATVSVVQATDGNLHMDPGLGKATYLHYYNNGIIYLNGTTYYISSNGSNYNGNAATATSATSATSAGYLTGGDSAFYALLYNALAGDLNTYNSPGLYSAEYTGSTNKPSGATNGHIIQISDAGGTDVKTQWYFPSAGVTPYMRLMWGNTNWNPWIALLTSSNYNSYSPTLTGTGASGTWAINITGNAATVTNATFYRQFTVRDDRSDGNDFSLANRPTGLYAIAGAGTNGHGASYTSLIHVANGSDVAFQISGGYVHDQMYFRGTSALQNGTGYTAWRTVIHNGNYSSYALPLSGGTLTGLLIANAGGRFLAPNDEFFSFTNVDSDSTHYTSRGGRLLTSNGSNWAADGTDAVIAITRSSAGTTRGQSIGLTLHNENNTTNAYSPAIVFSAVSNSGSYNSMYAAIMGKKTGQNAGVDSNWNKGELHFYAVGDAYVADTPNMTITGSVVNVGIGALQQGGNQVLHAGNYNSYAPTLTGTGASGTWGISITGNSAYSAYSDYIAAQTNPVGNFNVGLTRPKGASYTTTASTVTGAIKIKMPPGTPVHGMWKMTVKIYEYGQRGNGYTIELGCHLYPSTAYNKYQYMLTTDSGGVLPIRYGTDGTSGCIWIGENGTTWSYPQIHVTEFSNGFNNPSGVNWSTGTWAVSIGTIDNSVAVDGPYTTSLIVAASCTGTAGSISGFNNPTAAATANTIVYRDGAGHINANYIFGTYFNSSAGNSENPTIGQVWTQNTGDDYLRKSTPAHFISQLSLLTVSNYNSYAPTLTGTGASGTWGIAISGNAATASKTTANGGYTRVGYGMAPFYNWGGTNAGAGAPSDSTYTTGIDVGSHPSDPAYGFQIASNMWNVGLWTRSYNSGFGGWVRLLDSSNYSSYALPLSGGTLSGALTLSGNNYADFGPNSSWGATLRVGGNGNGGTGRASVATTNGNLHLDGSSGNGVYLNWYATSTIGVYFGNGAAGQVGRVDGSGNASFSGSISAASGTLYGVLTLVSVGTAMNFSGQADSFGYNATAGRGTYIKGTGDTYIYGGGKFYDGATWQPLLHAGNYSSYALPIGGGTLTSITKIKAGHNDTRFQLHYNHDGADTTSGNAGYLTLWASEPGISYAYTGIGGNINIGGNYYGRQTSGQAYGLYLRFETASGFSEFWATTGAVGSAGGQGSRVAYIDAAGNSVFSGNVTAYSDERLKKDWVALPADFIARLATVKSGTYTRVDSGARQAGSSAQDWKTLLPEVVSASNDEAQTLSLAYGNAALVSAVELAKDNVELRARIERLESLINKLIGD